MTTQQLTAILARHGLKVDEWAVCVGQYRDLQIGVGADQALLDSLYEDLRTQLPCTMKAAKKGGAYIEVLSFKWQE